MAWIINSKINAALMIDKPDFKICKLIVKCREQSFRNSLVIFYCEYQGT